MRGEQLGFWDGDGGEVGIDGVVRLEMRDGGEVGMDGVLRLEMRDGEVVFYRDFFDPAVSDRYFEQLGRSIDWRQDYIRLYDRQVALPRLTAWYADTGLDYTYSGITMQPQIWTPLLLEMKQAIESVAGVGFNSVLLNFYRNGQDSVAWHSDDEPELGRNPVIASVSLGAARRFQFRHRQDRSLKQEILLTHGSLLLMQGTTQHFWHHQIPKTAKPIGPRINLTFRIRRS